MTPRVLVLTLVSALAVATAAFGQSPLLSRATDLGPVNTANPIEITLWMKLHDQQGLDALVAAQQAGKAGYLSTEQVRAQHAPTPAEVAKVAEFLKAQGFTVTGFGQDNYFVRATATVAQVQSTFNVDLHQYTLNGRSFRASSRRATLPPALVPLVTAVGGLSDLAPEPQVARRVPRTAFGNITRQTDAEGMRAQPAPLNAQSNGLFFSAQCLYPPTSVNFSDPANGITATYQGNRYGAPITNGPPNASPCGYQPSDIQTAYNLSPLYHEGLTGKGTTVAIVDAYGSTTIAYDVAAFSQFMGLPAPDLTIIGTPTESNFSPDPQAGWASETTLDVEWVHSIAPSAKIVLVVAPTNSFTDLFNGIITAANVPGVVSISNSWSGFDIGIAGDSEFYNAADNILKAIGAAGESIQFSTGDYGDNAVQLGGFYTSTGWPASSPYATGIGGVSVVLDSQKHIVWQTSWGTNLTEIADTAALGNPPLDVPNNEGFVFGGTGGASDTYPKPFYQNSLPGDRRLTPDISWVADPYTGVEIIYSVDAQNDLGIDVIGGTSASCPMFSALWAIATQSAHHRLGQAAPRLYRLQPGAITDVVNSSSRNDVTGTIHDAGGTNPIRASELAAPLYNLPAFISALYNSPFSTRWFVLGFGLDSTLPAGRGWDPSTGLGTPNGWNFVHAFSHFGD
ncbi:MAG TPA: S53 family peptidase [Candidatus Sulfotelmatobacter sp.]|nr:S53 family peptidase [Candidatus Sulfotelmatobacter sp.]